MEVALADPEIAAATFRLHLDEFWKGGMPERRGWTRQHVDDLHEVVCILAVRQDGQTDPYHLLLGAEYYDAHPVRVTFVDPADLTEAVPGSRWLPSLKAQPAWFGLHTPYNFPDGPRQLVCFSFSFDYYVSGHNPQPAETWQQGRHTVAATLNRLYEVLTPPSYSCPQSEASR